MTKKKKIAVNTRFLTGNKLEGIGTYTHEVLQRLVHLLPEVEFHFLFDRTIPNNPYLYFNNVKAHVLAPQARHPFLWYLWFKKVGSWLGKNPTDLFLSLDSFLPLNIATDSLLVMHDLAFEHYPTHAPFLVQKYYQYFFPKYAKQAKHIMAVSEFTKNDIVDKYQIDNNKITLAPCGVSKAYTPLSEEEKRAIRSRVTKDKPYFLCVGSINPRKNMDSIIQAFNQLKAKKSIPHQLLIVGSKGWQTKLFYKTLEQSSFKDEVHLTGHLEASELNEVLNASEALVFTSLFEGFGIPIIEAFKTGTPVITSNVSSMPEVAGDSAFLVNPKHINEIANAMEKLCTPDTREEYAKKALARSDKYNWDSTAQIFANKISELINQGEKRNS